MKFKAFLTDNGINLLEKRILPSLDKISKICHLYLTPTHTYFLHNLLNSDGIQSITHFHVTTLFSQYQISSQNQNLISFSIDLSLLLRALRSLLTISSPDNHLQIKLVKKIPHGSTQATPYLTLEAKGYKSAVIQDVPVSKPLTPADVKELQAALENAQVMPVTLVKAPELSALSVFVDRIKNVGDVMRVSVGKCGDLCLRIETSLVTLGAEYRKLMVLGERADERGDAMSVEVSVKHFVKCLQSSLVAKPDCAFYGVGVQGGCLMVIFQFFVPGTRQTDKSISLHCRLPVLDSGSG